MLLAVGGNVSVDIERDIAFRRRRCRSNPSNDVLDSFVRGNYVTYKSHSPP